MRQRGPQVSKVGATCAAPMPADKRPIRTPAAPANSKPTMASAEPEFPRLSLPSSERYSKLAKELVESSRRMAAGGDPLHEAKRSLEAVISFMSADAMLDRAIAPSPLVVLHVAVHDLL